MVLELLIWLKREITLGIMISGYDISFNVNRDDKLFIQQVHISRNLIEIDTPRLHHRAITRAIFSEI